MVLQNRAKAHGIPWSPEETKAIQAGVDPDDVRAGCLTLEDVEVMKMEEKKKGKKRVSNMRLPELISYAKVLGISMDETGVTRADLILEIQQRIEKLNTVAPPVEQSAEVYPKAPEGAASTDTDDTEEKKVEEGTAAQVNE